MGRIPPVPFCSCFPGRRDWAQICSTGIFTRQCRGIQAHSIPGFQQSWHINLLQLINRRHACFNFDGKIWLQLACSLVQSVSNKELRWVFFFNENNKILIGSDRFGLDRQFILPYFFIWNYYI